MIRKSLRFLWIAFQYVLLCMSICGSVSATMDAHAVLHNIDTDQKVQKLINALYKAVDDWDGNSSELRLDLTSASAGEDIFTESDLLSALACFNSDVYPELFYYRQWKSYELDFAYGRRLDTVLYVDLILDSNYTSDDIFAFKNHIDEIVSNIKADWSEEQKALWIHDYLVTHTQYDLSYSKPTAYDVIIDGTGVCEGYSRAYKLLTERAGMRCEVVHSAALNHAWNLLYVDDVPYYVDCTWDDPLASDCRSHLYSDYCSHQNFLVNQEQLYSNHASTDWRIGETYLYDSGIASEYYPNSYWSRCITAIPHVGSLWAFCSWVGDEIFVHNYKTGDDTKLCKYFAIWYGPGGGMYRENYSHLCSDDRNFYASGPLGIIKVTTSGEVSSFYRLTEEEQKHGYIFGIRAENNELIYSVGARRDDTSFFQGTIPLDNSTSKVEIEEITFNGQQVLVSISNNDTCSLDAVLIMAFYETDGRMVYVKSSTVHISPDETKALTFTLLKDDVSEIGVFLIDSENATPVCPHKTVSRP